MTIELPDKELSPSELRLELACEIYARGCIGKVVGAEIAGVDFFTFQHELRKRQIPAYTEEMLETDIASIQALFPKE